MSAKSTRRKVITPATDFFADIDQIVDPVVAPPPPDPARLAARILLTRAIEKENLSFNIVARDGAVCVIIVPSNDWVVVVRDEWRSGMRSGERFQDGTRDGWWHVGDWLAWMPEDEPRALTVRDSAEAFAKAVANGLHCAGFAANENWLPADVVYSADHRLTLSALTPDCLGAITLEFFGKAAFQTLTNNEAAALTPRLLRLARRLEQSADDYVIKLRDLLSRAVIQAAQAIPESSGSPRDEPSLDRLHGIDQAVAWGRDVARDLSAYRDGTISWADVDRGCLLSGPPGCGKTLFARAMAKTCEVPIITGSYGAWLGTGSGHQGDLLESMKKSFADARAMAPSILFIDEIDSFPNRGTITHHFAEWEIQVVNALLAEIDGVEGREGVILVAACNHPDRLDPALVRSGRLDRHIRIGLPDRPALAQILREHLGADLKDVDLTGAALGAMGRSGADCEFLVRGARRRARAADREMLLADLLDEIGGVNNRSAADLWACSVHEAGHVAAIATLHPGSVDMVSLVGRGSQGGATVATVEVSGLMRTADLKDRLLVLLAGRAAEHEILGTPSSGSGGAADSDLAIATGIAATAATALGLEEDGGLTWTAAPDAHRLHERLAADPALAKRVRRRLDDAYAAAQELVRSRKKAITALATALVERRVIDGAEAEAIIRSAGAQP